MVEARSDDQAARTGAERTANSEIPAFGGRILSTEIEMTGRYRQTYRWNQAAGLAPACGLIIGVLEATATHHTVGPALTGLGTMFGIFALWGYRIRYQRRERAR